MADSTGPKEHRRVKHVLEDLDSKYEQLVQLVHFNSMSTMKHLMSEGKGEPLWRKICELATECRLLDKEAFESQKDELHS